MTEFGVRLVGGRRTRWAPLRVPRRVAAAVTARAGRHAGSGVDLPERGFLLFRRLLPAVAALFLAEAFFFAGYMVQLLAVPLTVMMVAGLAAETVWGYRTDLRARLDLVGLDRERRRVEEVLRNRERELQDSRRQAADDLDRVASGAVRMATVPALLSAQLQLLTPLVADLVATTSAGRRAALAGQLERAAVLASLQLLNGGNGTGARAVLYRRDGRRFLPVAFDGGWSHPPPGAGRTSGLARELRLVLRERRPVTWTESPDGRLRSGVRVPVHAGRGGLGVLCADRPGDEPGRAEIEALAAVAGLLAAGTAARRRLDGRHPVVPAAPSGGARDAWIGGLAGVGRSVPGAVASRIWSLTPGHSRRG